jgi:hypothetical protein
MDTKPKTITEMQKEAKIKGNKFVIVPTNLKSFKKGDRDIKLPTNMKVYNK